MNTKKTWIGRVLMIGAFALMMTVSVAFAQDTECDPAVMECDTAYEESTETYEEPAESVEEYTEEVEVIDNQDLEVPEETCDPEVSDCY